MVDGTAVIELVGSHPSLSVYGMEYKLHELARKLKMKPGEKQEVFFKISPQKKLYKSNPQLGYLYGHLAPLALIYINDMGWQNVCSKEAAVEWFKEPLGFIDTQVNDKTGEVRAIEKSVSTATREEVANFVDQLFIQLHTAGYSPMTPTEYKNKKKQL